MVGHSQTSFLLLKAVQCSTTDEDAIIGFLVFSKNVLSNSMVSILIKIILPGKLVILYGNKMP